MGLRKALDRLGHLASAERSGHGSIGTGSGGAAATTRLLRVELSTLLLLWVKVLAEMFWNRVSVPMQEKHMSIASSITSHATAGMAWDATAA